MIDLKELKYKAEKTKRTWPDSTLMGLADDVLMLIQEIETRKEIYSKLDDINISLNEKIKTLENDLRMCREIGVEMQREVNSKLSVKFDIAMKALKHVVKIHWFDGFDEKYRSIACSCCDMGDSGAKINRDKHDLDCAISICYEALEEIKLK